MKTKWFFHSCPRSHCHQTFERKVPGTLLLARAVRRRASGGEFLNRVNRLDGALAK